MASSLENISVKRALLIGNNNYKQGHRLEYCINNVKDLQKKLESIDFHVTIGIDLICEDLDTIIEDFIQEINPNDFILFFYSGYGIHLNEQNYFLPIDDQQLKDTQMFEYRAINVQTTIDMIINRRPSSSIFILDLSRSYFIPTQTTARDLTDYGGFSTIESYPNTLIICSADKNKTIIDKSTNGRNSIFVYHLLQYIDQVNLPIDELIDIVSDQINNETDHQQSPLIISSIRKNLYFNYQIQSG
jgi:uncharacterized caspase-like protein